MATIEKPSKNLDGESKESKNQKNWIKGVGLIFGISIFGGLAAGIISAKMTKKKTLQYYKALNIEPKVVPESPSLLAMKALGWATLYTVGFFSIVGFATCMWFDIKSLDDLRKKIKTYSQRKRKINENSLEFETFSDFIKYLEENSSKPNEHKKQN